MRNRLTPRDLQIMQSLAIGRYLTAPALEWLHFPDWRERWAAYVAQREQRRNDAYEISTRVYRRLRFLHGNGLIHRIIRPLDVAVDAFRRAPDVYTLARQGAELLTAHTDMARECLWWEEPRERSFNMLAHGALIGQFYAALQAKIASMRGVALENWRGDHLLRRDYDHVPAKVPTRTGGSRLEQLPVVPDAAFTIRHKAGSILCFVEIDRGRPIETWRRKVMAYHAYVGSAQLRARYERDAFIVLTATTTEQQRTRLMEATTRVVGGAADSYLFTLIRDLHPTSIGRWLKVASATPRTRPGLGGQITTYDIEVAEHMLLR